MRALKGLLITAVVLAVLGGGYWLFFENHGGDTASATPKKQAAATAPPVSQEELNRIERAVNSGNVKTQATVIVPSNQAAFIEAGKPMTYAGEKVVIDPHMKVNHQLADAKATSTVVDNNGKKQTYRFSLVLAFTNNHWYILYVKEA